MDKGIELIEYLEHIDRQLLLLINGCHSSFWDAAMIQISGTFIWIPLYAVLLFLLYRIKKGNFWLLLLFIVMVIYAADQLSVNGFKEVFQRYRPCHNTELKNLLHLPAGVSGGKYGFVSSHAANTFALVGFVSSFTRKNWLFISLIVWASLVSYSRVYLGVHYPSDVLGGAILGLIIGTVFYFLYQNASSFLIARSKPIE
jgi:undecaprenyl-diphosphatase